MAKYLYYFITFWYLITNSNLKKHLLCRLVIFIHVTFRKNILTAIFMLRVRKDNTIRAHSGKLDKDDKNQRNRRPCNPKSKKRKLFLVSIFCSLLKQRLYFSDQKTLMEKIFCNLLTCLWLMKIKTSIFTATQNVLCDHFIRN